MNSSTAGGRDVLRVRELVHHSALDLALAAGSEGADRPIESVYIGDLDDPIPWMLPGSLLLTTGRAFVDDPAVGVRLIHALADHDMAGVGVAITPYVLEVDAAMARAADERDLPLVVVPPVTPFRDVSGYIHDVLASRDLGRLRRSLALQDQLLQALRHSGRAGLLKRLELLTGMPAVLFGPGGGVLGTSPGVGRNVTGLAKLWGAYAAVAKEGRPRSVFSCEEGMVAFREIRVRPGEVDEVLMVFGEASAGVAERAEAALSFAHRLLELELSAESSALGEHVAERDSLLSDILSGRGTASELTLKLAHNHFTGEVPWYMVMLGPQCAGSGLSRNAAESVELQLEREGIPFLCAAGQECHALLLAVPACEFGAVTHRLVGSLNGREVVGCSVAIGAVDSVARGAMEAACALLAAQRLDCADDPVAFGSLGPVYAGLCEATEERLRVFGGDVCEQLRAVDTERGSELLETLDLYLRFDASVSATAEQLFVHRNALRKRLDRIEAVTDLRLDTTDGLVRASISLAACTVSQARRLASSLS